MHDVLDPRDLVPDEAQQLDSSGYPVGDLGHRAITAAAEGDLGALAGIAGALARLERAADWPFVETSDDAELAALTDQVAALPVDLATLERRILGAWTGRTVANTMGKPVEGLTRVEVELYLRASGQWPQTGYLPLLDPLPQGVSHLHESAPFSAAGRFTDIPRDDDLDWTVLGLSLLEAHGSALTTEAIAAEWLDALPFTQTFTAERAAYRNLIGGIRPPETATHDNPYREWIGALIRADIFGMVLPGKPAAAARLAIVDARLSHIGNGIYGEMWAAALVSAAMAVTDARAAFDVALGVVPPTSRLHRALVGVRDLRETDASAIDALNWVDTELGQYNWVHTINNAALISIGLLWGATFVEAVGLTISGGRDTDSSAATVGSVFGALHGPEAIPGDLIGSTHIRLSSSVRGFDKISLAELAQRTFTVYARLDADSVASRA
ncbi:MAG: ADP-ribosylation/Crystallin [Naasia sp.]|nr:ADP-ribosylation/Crystallin [Naasia sp.]